MCIPWERASLLAWQEGKVRTQIELISWRWPVILAHFPESVLKTSTFRAQKQCMLKNIWPKLLPTKI